MPFISSIRRNYQQKKEGESILDKVKITGGNSIITAGGYRIHMFTATGDHKLNIEAKDPSKSAEIAQLFSGDSLEYLVIAGGGGTIPQGGGGGAGGYRTGTDVQAVLGAIPVTVGRGGDGNGWQGVDSSFGSITSNGGGHGGPYNNPGNSGGSGGGAGRDNRGWGRTSGQPGQGNGGGTNFACGWSAAGGGGGAGGGGNDGGGQNWGNSNGDGGRGPGGPGLNSSITGSPVTRAGGGGGASHAGPWIYQPGGDGGPGGGGRGQDYPWGDYSSGGSTNTGSGGGGVVNYYQGGGPGIVVVRYLI